MHPRKHSGGALLTALFIMTLVAIVATAMTTSLQLDIYRTRLLLAQDKVSLASEAVMFWAFEELTKKNLNLLANNSEGLVAQFPKNLSTIYKDMNLSGSLYDLQSRYNLNNVADNAPPTVLLNMLRKNFLN